MSDPLADLTDRWRSDADALERNGCGARAELLRRHADEVEDALQRWGDEPLPISRASRVSGYSRKHLRRMVRNGRLPAVRPAGEDDRILVRRKHLPRKPASDRPDDGPNPVAEHVRKVRSP